MGFNKFRTKYIGSKSFYKMIFAVAVPIMVQEGFTNFVNMLDNLMVGRVGTDQMNGVSIVGQLLVVFNLTVFGALSGAGIFVSQFHGGNNKNGERNVFKIKLILGALILATGILVFTVFPNYLIGLFLNEGGNTGDPVKTLAFANDYLRIMLIGLPPFVLCQCCTNTLRETEQTVIPMRAGITAVITNVVLNWVLIYGKLGFPVLGVKGAAVATVISRFVECGFVLIYSLTHKEKCAFIHSLGEAKLTKELTFDVIKKALPLMVNELFWSGGMTLIAQCYSTRGLSVVAAVNIANIIHNLFAIIFSATGASIAIIVGNLLGADKMKEAKDTDTKMLFTSVCGGFITGCLLLIAAPLFPKLYNTSDEVRLLAAKFIMVLAVLMPFDAFCHGSYFTLRSGGKTLITALFDSCFVWLFPVLTGFILSRFTSITILPLYIICNGLNIVKSIIGAILVHSDIWMQNIVSKGSDQ